jgi:transcription termination/antitermination protein NusG
MIALDKNPPVISPPGIRVEIIAGPWWVAHTRSRHEKALAFDLLTTEVSYFLPMVERTLIIRNRRFRGKLPVFPGYVFVAGDDEVRYRALSTSHVASIIPVVDQGRLVYELRQIQRALETPAGLDPFPYLHKGVRCRITGGPLRGTQGIVVERGGITRLVLQIEILGQAVATEVDSSFLEVVN